MQSADTDTRESPLLEVRHLSKRYARPGWIGRRGSEAIALHDVNLSIDRCSTVALVGKSGSGKSTLARCVALLEKPDRGEIFFEGRDVLAAKRDASTTVRRNVQLLFQHSSTALNPRFSAVTAVEEPLVIQRVKGRKERRNQALAMMERVGFSSSWADRLPRELSGGQRQRLALARTLVMKPKLLVLDEALAGLDLTLQAQIAQTLRDLQAALSLSYLFITHDLRMAANLADRISVMEQGRVIESGSAEDLFFRSKEGSTQELIEAIPRVPARGGKQMDAAL